MRCLSPSQLVDAAMTRDAAQPRDHVSRRFEARQAPIQLEEYFLREVLGRRPAAQGVQREAEHHRLVAPDDRRERGGVAAARQ